MIGVYYKYIVTRENNLSILKVKMTVNRNNILVTFRLQSSLVDIIEGNFWKSLIAEAFGTFILVFIGLGSCYGSGGVIAAAFAFGLGGALGIWISAPISGGNINPAVSLGLLFARKMSLFQCIFYMIFQFFGALAASALMKFLTFDQFSKIHGLSSKNVSAEKAFYCEIIITFVLVFTVMRMCVEKSRSDTERGVAALAIGISITVGILCGASISGGSMNPARSLGPAVANLYFKDIWIYVAGPLIGGALAGLLQQLIFTSELSKEHIISYLTNPLFGIEGEYKKENQDVESLCSLEKSANMGAKKSPKNSPKKSIEQHELLKEDDIKFQEIHEECA